MAYANGKKNPFKGYSSHDFTVGKGGNVSLVINKSFVGRLTGQNKLLSSGKNEFELLVTRLPFDVEITGFDESRDLVVDVRKVKLTDDLIEEGV